MGAKKRGTGKPSDAVEGQQNRRRVPRREPYAWLAAGAVGVGITTAALAGAGVAYADDTTGSAPSSQSGGADNQTDDREPSDSTSDDADDATTTDDATDDDTDNDAVDDDAGDDGTDDDTDPDDDTDGDDADPGDDTTTPDDPVQTPEEPVETVDDPTPDDVPPPDTDRPDRDDTTNEADQDQTEVDAAEDEAAQNGTADDASIDEPEQAEADEQAPVAEVSNDAVPNGDSTSTPAESALESTEESTVEVVEARQVAEPSAAYLTQVRMPPTAPQPAMPNWRDVLAAIVRMATIPITPTSANRVNLASQETLTGEPTALAARSLAATAAVVGQPPYDSGLNVPFVQPTYPTGTIRNVRDYGATSGNANDNDATAINAAINASQPGDAVYIPNGTYHVYSTINLKPGVSLSGQSRTGTTLIANSESPLHAVIYAPPGTNNLIIQSMRITVADGKQIGAGVRLGIEGGSNVSRISVRDMQIERFTRFGVQIQNGNNILVENNIIRNAAALGGDGQGYGVIIDQAGSNNNWVRNNTIGPTIRHAILIQESAHHNLIDNNRITGAVSGAIDLHGEDEYSNEIRYNVISDCVPNGTTVSPNGAGIEIGEYSGTIGDPNYHDNSGPNNWIHHNTVYNCSCGLRVTNNSNYTYIEDNNFYNNWDAGIRADLAPLNNLYIRRNTITNNAYGILLYDVTNATVENNVVRNNRNYGIGGNYGTTGYYVAGNTVTGSMLNYIFQSTNGYLDVRDGARRA